MVKDLIMSEKELNQEQRSLLLILEDQLQRKILHSKILKGSQRTSYPLKSLYQLAHWTPEIEINARPFIEFKMNYKREEVRTSDNR